MRNEVNEYVEHLRLDPNLRATPTKDDAIQVQLAVSESDHLTDRSRDDRPLSASGSQFLSMCLIGCKVDVASEEAGMKFATGLPGLMRYPPSQFPPGGDNWQERLTSEDFQRIAQVTEQLGYDAITVSEHIVMPRVLVGSMGAYWPDALTAMTFIAGATTKIRVNSSVIVLPYHEPLAFAKAIATLDVLSSGRVTLTFGVGMARGEFDSASRPVREARTSHR